MPMRERHHVADELESRFASDRYTLTDLATFTKANLPTILAALREGHLEGDAVAGAEDEWRPGMLAINARHDVPGVFPALGRAACVQAVEHDHGAVYLQLGPGNSHTYLADLLDHVLPAKTGGRHGD